MNKWRLKQAERAIANNQYTSAEQILTQVLSDLPQQSEAYANVTDRLANLYLEIGQWENASRLFTAVVQALLRSGRQDNDDAIVEVRIGLRNNTEEHRNRREGM